jgi:hypothetical protein
MTMRRLAIVIIALLRIGPALAQGTPPALPDTTFRSSSNLVLVDVIARNARTGLPDKTLKRDDFQVFDNDQQVSLKSFDSGAESTTRPLALWLVAQCVMQSWETRGSGLFRGRAGLFTPALKEMDRHDAVAVAHWCDNGDAQLDLLPTKNVEEAAATLERVLAPTLNPDNHNRPGELALQKSLQLIIDATRSSKPERLPVVIFLYGDWSGMPKAEADHFIDELLETSALAFGLRDRQSPHMWFLPGEQKEVAHYIVKETGGQYLEITPDTYTAGLQGILQQLHFRYELGFQPATLDGKRHKLMVKLSDAARSQHQEVRLRCRPDYVPVAQAGK